MNISLRPGCFDQAPHGPVIVHCDAARARKVAKRALSRAEALRQHTEAILRLADERPVWLPTFNYDFCRTGTFDVRKDKSQVGPISEYFRTNSSEWRTSIPVFSFSGTGNLPITGIESKEQYDPFGEQSLFAKADGLDGSILWYGAPLSSTTIIHYLERISKGAPYRYDKVFHGTVLSDGEMVADQIRLSYHVRPMGLALEYDWIKIEKDLVLNCPVIEISREFGLSFIPIRTLISFWREKIVADNLYFLNEDSRLKVSKLLDKFGRPFKLDDFEMGF